MLKSAHGGDCRRVVAGVLLSMLAPAAAHPFSPAEITAAFQECHRGYSSDELLIQDDLRHCFLRRLAGDDSFPLPADAERDALLALLKLRKTGKLAAVADRRGPAVDPTLYPVAEIAARAVIDRHRISIDRLLADPRFRAELSREAAQIVPDVAPYSLRKAVLALRKKRALRPELVLQVAQWQRRVETYGLDELRAALADGVLHRGPGIYLFRAPRGYLYIGEAGNLSARLAEHLEGDGQRSLVAYLHGAARDEVTVELHTFAADSPARQPRMRRAYESELIRSRRPEFNIRP